MGAVYKKLDFRPGRVVWMVLRASIKEVFKRRKRS